MRLESLIIIGLVAVSASSPASASAQSSINRPRGENDAKGDKKDVLVRLPDDLEAVLKAQKADRSQIHASILGLNNADDFGAIFSSESPTTTSTAATAKATTATTTTRRRKTTTRRPTTTTTRSTTTSTFSTTATTAKKPTKTERSFWALAWEAHVYFSGTLFVLLAIYCAVNLLRLHTFSRLFRRGYFVALNVCLILVGVVRPLFLFIDPYNVSSTLPRTVAYLLLDTAFPCITTAFAVLFLALLRATQIELVSPGFQRPRALAIFCAVHLALSVAIDVAIGARPEVKYAILICQGFFIVWSLLLSAGYFYVYSAMKKIALREHGDVMHRATHHPKVAIDPTTGAAFAFPVEGAEPVITASARPPLARAVHLTLGVAVLGSLMGGVQLFGMIKMLALQWEDLNADKSKLPWYCYQVSMRILEVAVCTLLAVIATTPLRTDPTSTLGDTPSGTRPDIGAESSKVRRVLRRVLFCWGDANPPREFEDEIYSEICSNNQSVRQMMMANPHQQQHIIHDVNGGGPMLMMENPYGTLSRRIAMNQQMMPMGTLRTSSSAAQGNGSSIASGSANRQRNSATVNSITSSSSNPNSTLQSGRPASSRATIDTGLYSNVRSRPSSMLFNDSGFVRFRTNGDPGLEQEQVLRQSTGDLTKADREARVRSSQSFEEALMGDRDEPQLLSPASNPEDQSQRQMQHSPIYKSLDGSEKDAKEDIYEPPPGMKLPPKGDPLRRPSNTGIYSESDLESAYGAKFAPNGGIYSSRAESRCSSISATQSFDMRMYGKTMATAASAKDEANGKEKKLENPYYYYGSTRNQKKLKQKPRPLLPSQRQQMEQQQRASALPARPSGRPVNRLERQQAVADTNAPFQRSRSLGGYYNRNTGASQTMQQQMMGGAPIRNQHFFQQQQAAAARAPMGSMTPVTYSRWQHAQRQGEPRRYNPLYDTPPTQRHAHLQQQLMLQQQRLQQEQDELGAEYVFDERGNAIALRPQQFATHFRVQPQFYPLGPASASPSQMRRQLHQPQRVQHGPPPLVAQHSMPMFSNNLQRDELLSPILTDQESNATSPPLRRNPSSRREPHTGEFYLSDSEDDADVEDSDVASTFDRFTSQATQGYAEGLADVESEASTRKGAKDKAGGSGHVVSPLEYSAMLKLYSQESDAPPIAPVRTTSSSQRSKDITPDSGVVTENNSEQRNGAADKKGDSSKRKSRQSLLSSSSSLNDLLEKDKSGKKIRSEAKNARLRDYSRVSTSERSDNNSGGGNNTVFSSTSGEDDSSGDEKKALAEKRYHPLVSPPASEQNFPAFRWDGSAMAEKAAPQPKKRESKQPPSSNRKQRKSADNAELDGAEQVVRACKEIQKQLREKKSDVEMARKKASEVEGVI